MNRPLLCLFASLLAMGRLGAEPSLMEHLIVFLTGSFTNAAQARGDQNFRATALNVTTIWNDRSDGPWLYLEQALVGAEEHPYRQVVYQVSARADNTFELRMFEPLDLLAVTGAWKDPHRFNQLTPANLASRGGCALVMRFQADGSFKGGTEGKECTSTLRGATYAATEAVITNREIIFWERGFNVTGAQVWGSIHGGHIFKRVE